MGYPLRTMAPKFSGVRNMLRMEGLAKVNALAKSSCRKASIWFWIVLWIAGFGVSRSCAQTAPARLAPTNSPIIIPRISFSHLWGKRKSWRLCVKDEVADRRSAQSASQPLFDESHCFVHAVERDETAEPWPLTLPKQHLIERLEPVA